MPWPRAQHPGGNIRGTGPFTDYKDGIMPGWPGLDNLVDLSRPAVYSAIVAVGSWHGCSAVQAKQADLSCVTRTQAPAQAWTIDTDNTAIASNPPFGTPSRKPSKGIWALTK